MNPEATGGRLGFVWTIVDELTYRDLSPEQFLSNFNCYPFPEDPASFIGQGWRRARAKLQTANCLFPVSLTDPTYGELNETILLTGNRFKCMEAVGTIAGEYLHWRDRVQCSTSCFELGFNEADAKGGNRSVQRKIWSSLIGNPGYVRLKKKTKETICPDAWDQAQMWSHLMRKKVKTKEIFSFQQLQRAPRVQKLEGSSSKRLLKGNLRCLLVYQVDHKEQNGTALRVSIPNYLGKQSNNVDLVVSLKLPVEIGTTLQPANFARAFEHYCIHAFLLHALRFELSEFSRKFRAQDKKVKGRVASSWIYWWEQFLLDIAPAWGLGDIENLDSVLQELFSSTLRLETEWQREMDRAMRYYSIAADLPPEIRLD